MAMGAVTVVLVGAIAWSAISFIGGAERSNTARAGDTTRIDVSSPDDPGEGTSADKSPGTLVVSAPSSTTSTSVEVVSALSSSTTRGVRVVSVPSSSSSTTVPPTTTTTTTVPPTTITTTTTTLPPTTTTTVPPTTTTTTVPPKSCEVDMPRADDEQSSPKLVSLTTDDPVCLAIAISDRVLSGADRVIVAHLSDLYGATIVAQLAARQSAPLLYYRQDSEAVLSAELERLAPAEVWMMADVPESVAPDGAEVVRVPSALVDLVAWVESIPPRVESDSSPTADGRSRPTPEMISGVLGRALVPFFWFWSQPPEQAPLPDPAEARRARRLWLVDPGQVATELAVAAFASIEGEQVIHWDPEEISGWKEAGQAIEEHAREVDEIWIAGKSSESGRWFVETTLWGEELPGGGRLLFPDRRLVAFYGAITTGVLGVLGERDPAGTLERMGPYLEAYSEDGIMTVPTFEIIVTVAARDAGPDGDYSREFNVDTLMPWVEFAAQNGVYVMLDLQPGRSDFLSQAKQYERLLKLPHVGLALDPEWRLGPNERHLVQIGSVRAEEVNRVIEWLAALVRRERLPQKLLIVHQFRLDMISNRKSLQTPPELAVMLHMDGQGSLGSKYNTWNFLTAGVQDRNWWWGWKNFFDEDSPLARPDQVLDLQPTVHFVSFQ